MLAIELVYLLGRPELERLPVWPVSRARSLPIGFGQRIAGEVAVELLVDAFVIRAVQLECDSVVGGPLECLKDLAGCRVIDAQRPAKSLTEFAEKSDRRLT